MVKSPASALVLSRFLMVPHLGTSSAAAPYWMHAPVAAARGKTQWMNWDGCAMLRFCQSCSDHVTGISRGYLATPQKINQ